MRGTSLADTGMRVFMSRDWSFADVGVIALLAVLPLLCVADVVEGGEYSLGSRGGVPPPVGELRSCCARRAACAMRGDGSEMYC